MIDPGQAFSYFDKNHGPLRPSTNGWYEARCPYCDTYKMAVSFDKLKVKCWKGCFDKTFITYFISKYEDIRYFEAEELIDSYDSSPLDYTFVSKQVSEVSPIELPRGYKSLLGGSGALGDRARAYLSGRGFDLEYLNGVGVGYCNDHDNEDDYFGYIIIPFKRQGKLAYFIGRDYIGNGLRYKNPPRAKFGVGKGEVLFNEEGLYMHRQAFITEGWADAATMSNQGVSIQGLDIGMWQTSMIINSPVEEVVIALDAGQYKQGLKQALKLFKFKVVKVLDLNLLKEHGDDINEIGAERVLELTQNTKPVGFASLYKQLRTS